MMIHNSCPACLGTNITKVFSAVDFTVSKKEFQINECATCAHRFTSPVPDEAEIGYYYKSEEYISHSDSQRGLIHKIYQRVRKRALRQKSRLICSASNKRTGSILDIGCGTGHFLKEMKSAGWNIQGIEPDADARQKAATNTGVSIEKPEALFSLTSPVDVVSMWHVLEHVHRLDDYLDHIFRLLNENGVFVVAVPNYQSLDADVYQENWAAYDVPRHLYHFCPSSMKALLERKGFRIVQMRRMPFDSFYVSLLSEKIRGGNSLRGWWVGLRSWVASLGKPSRCSSIIYLIQKGPQKNDL